MGTENSKPPPPENWTHLVKIKTGDKKGAGCNGNIFVSFTDANGEQTADNRCDVLWKNDFEDGEVDYFYFDFHKLGKPTEMRISRDRLASRDAWYIEKVEVDCRLGDMSVFPIHRWLHASSVFYVREYDCSLPQFENNPQQRAEELKRKRDLYVLVPNDGLPAQLNELPPDEEFSGDYKRDIGKLLIQASLHAKFVDFFTPKLRKLKDFGRLFKGRILTTPYGILNWESDEEFGNQRLTGCNPTAIKLCTKIPDHMPVTDDMVKEFLEGYSLSEALKKKKIYYVDYRFLSDVTCNDYTRKLPGPTALFYSKKNEDFVPIAIQLMPKHSVENPIFTPDNGELKYTWLVAKIFFNLADSSHHQAVTHLGFTHLLMESIALCAHRQLSPSHPIFRLLAPHFLYLMAINSAARSTLINVGGTIDRTMLMGRIGVMNIIKPCWREWNLQEFGSLPGDLKRRGVDDVEALPGYSFRDDALLMWTALENYVTKVVNGHYDTPEKLKQDHEIQAWAKELSDSQRANVKGVPKAFKRNEELIEVLTCAIYIGSVGHAAANFNQYDEYACTPNYPALLYGSPPTTKKPLTEANVLEYLPDKKGALDMAIVTKLLSEKSTNSFADFEVQYAYDPITLRAVEELRSELVEVGKTIDDRNKKRVRPYPYLHPDVVPNAISI